MCDKIIENSNKKINENGGINFFFEMGVYKCGGGAITQYPPS